MVSLTAQQWFDAAWERAKTPIKNSQPPLHHDHPDRCKYYPVNDDTPPCFIGVCLDEETQRRADNLGDASLLLSEGIIDVSGWASDSASALLTEIQQVHDRSSPAGWHSALREAARRWDLTVPEEK